MNLPDEMTPAIKDVLGLMIFSTAPIAHLLRETGDVSIPRKAEEEQAHVMWLFLRLAIEHGDEWRAKAHDMLELREEIKRGRER